MHLYPDRATITTLAVIAFLWSTHGAPAEDESSNRGTPKATPTQVKQARKKAEHRRAVFAIRSALGKASSASDSSQKASYLEQAKQRIENQLAVTDLKPMMKIDLLTLKVKMHIIAGDLVSAKNTVQMQHNEHKAHFGEEKFNDWIDPHIERLRNTRAFDHAILHQRELITLNSESIEAAERSLWIGDVLVQKSYPDGPYNDAIEHFAQTAEVYRAQFPNIADDARLRQGKGLWKNGQIQQAKKLFEDLSRTANEAVAEESRHYPELMEALASRPFDPQDAQDK